MVDYLLMGVMALLWAGSFIVGKFAVSSVAPEMVAFLRFLIAGVVMVAILAVWQPGSLRLRRGDWLLVLGLGSTGIAAYHLFFFWGIRLSLVSDGAMIVPTLNPLVTLFLAAVLLKEPLTPRKLVGVSISLVGQSMIFWTLLGAAAQDPQRLLGDLLYVAGAILWSVYTILGRIASRRFTPMAANTWAALSGTVILAPFALWSAPGSTGYTQAFWGQILYISVGATVGGYFLFSRGIHRLGAGRAAIFHNLVPVTTVVMAYLVLGERPTWLQVAGMLLVLSGVYLAGTVPVRAPAPLPPTRDQSVYGED